MRKVLKNPAVAPFSLLLMVLSGCFPAHLPPLESPPALGRLQDLADSEIAFSVNTSPVDGLRGYQFLTVVPVTRVYTPDLAREVSDLLKIQAGLKGYRLVSAEVGAAGKPAYSLSVTVEDLTVSGYCYLAIRRPYSKVRLSGTLRAADGTVLRECSGEGRSVFFAKFAFDQELNEARRIALTDAAVALTACLELPKPAIRK